MEKMLGRFELLNIKPIEPAGVDPPQPSVSKKKSKATKKSKRILNLLTNIRKQSELFIICSKIEIGVGCNKANKEICTE